MFHIPFWIFLGITFIIFLVAISIHKLNFIDIQIIIMVIAVTMSLDMLFCKQLSLYNYVNVEYRGWYSFWANFIITPAFAIIFIKFIPNGRRKITFYILMWSIFCTLLELYVLRPTGIVHYSVWEPFPFSTIGYVLVLVWEYAYFRILENQLK